MRAYLHDGQEPNELHRPDTLRQDQIPPSSPISLATHRRSIHSGHVQSSKPGSAGSQTRLLLPTKLPRAEARAPVSRCSKSPLVPRAGCRSGSGDQTLQADFDRLWPPRCHHVHSTPAFFHSPPVGSTALGAPIYPCHHLNGQITRGSTASNPRR